VEILRRDCFLSTTSYRQVVKVLITVSSAVQSALTLNEAKYKPLRTQVQLSGGSSPGLSRGYPPPSSKERISGS
jgi:hypothetical protein